MSDKITILMVCYNHADLTEKAIQSLVDNTGEDSYILYILDNSTDYETEKLWRKFRTQLPTIRYSKFDNVGWIKAIHATYSRVTTEFFLTVHNDVIFEKDWLPKMMRQFKHNKVAAVGPLISFVQAFQSANWSIPGLIGEYVNFIVGLFCVFRKVAVDELIAKDGYFMDEQFGLGDKEEHDYCIRLGALGWRLRIARNVMIQHHGEKGFADVLGGKDNFHAYQNTQLAKLEAKWGTEKINDLYKLDLTKRLSISAGLPLAGDYSGHRKFWRSLVMMGKPGYFQLIDAPRLMTPVARNAIVEKALELGSDYLLFIDDDMIIPPDGLIRLLNHDKDIVCGLAFQRIAPHYPCIFRNVGEDIFPMEVVRQGLFEIDACGSAFILISMEVFKKMPKPWYVFADKSMGIYVDKGGLGEDISFSLKAKRLGFEIFCDTDLIVTHLGDNREVTEKDYFEYHKPKEVVDDSVFATTP